MSELFNVPEQYRKTKGYAASDKSYGNNGVFNIPMIDKIGRKLFFLCIASDGEGWEHVSVTVYDKSMNQINRTPTWDEMCFIKNKFWSEDATVIQFHPAKADYVNNHPYCLHLWRSTNEAQPKPNADLIGFK